MPKYKSIFEFLEKKGKLENVYTNKFSISAAIRAENYLKRTSSKRSFRRFYKRNKEKLNQKSLNWSQNNPEKVKEIQNRYSKSEKGIAKRKRFYSNNKEKLRKKALDSYYKNKEYILAKQYIYKITTLRQLRTTKIFLAYVMAHKTNI